MIEYVVGFLLDPLHVVLVRKNRPQWQAGKLNGVGGKVEADELVLGAMRREFEEEAGLRIDDWDHLATLRCENRYHVSSTIYFFRHLDEGTLVHQVRSMTDEAIEIDEYEPLDIRETA